MIFSFYYIILLLIILQENISCMQVSIEMNVIYGTVNTIIYH